MFDLELRCTFQDFKGCPRETRTAISLRGVEHGTIRISLAVHLQRFINQKHAGRRNGSQPGQKIADRNQVGIGNGVGRDIVRNEVIHDLLLSENDLLKILITKRPGMAGRWIVFRMIGLRSMPGDPVPTPHSAVPAIITISIAVGCEQDFHGEHYITQVDCRQDDQLLR
jgi:hypothetical protein